MPEPDQPKQESPSKRVWQLAWPNILSNLLFTTVGFIHIKIVAELGTSAVAAVTTGHRVFFLMQAILMGVSVAATALIARSWGAEKIKHAEMVAWASIVLSLTLAVLLTVPALLIPEQIAGLFGLDNETTRQAGTFIFWLGMFNVFTALNLMLSTALRATGDVITPLWFLLYSSILSGIMAYLLAFGVGPFPMLGVAGVALGGGVSSLVVTVLFVVLWWRGRFNLKPIKSFSVDRDVVRQLTHIGLPAVVEQGVIQLAFLAFFAIIARYGTEAYAAYGIGISLVSFAIVIGFGFGIATATIVGQQLGAGNPELAVASTWRSLRMAVAAMVVLSVLSATFAREMAEFMIDDPVVVQLTTAFIYMIAVAQPLMACEFTLAGALRGAGDTRFPLIATFCGIILGRLLPALIFVNLGISVYWLFAVLLLDYAIKASMLLYRFRSHKWLQLDITPHSA